MNPQNADEGSSASADAQLAEPLTDESMPHVPKRRSNFESRRVSSEQQSLVAGLSGLAAIALLLGIAVPIEVKLLNEFNVGKPTYIWMQILVQSMMLPPMVAFSFAAVTPMFWYGSVILRFAMAMLAVLPGCIGFVFTLVQIESGAPYGFVHSFSLVMFTCLIAIATVALIVQLWSRWTLAHARSDVASLPPTGISSMIELTCVAAVVCAVFMSSEIVEYLHGMFLFGGLGFLAAITIIIAQITFLRDEPRSRAATIASFAFAFAAAFAMNSYFGVREYGWDVLTGELFWISATSLYGAFLICVLIWFCLRWLRFWGWQCVDRSVRR